MKPSEIKAKAKEIAQRLKDVEHQKRLIMADLQHLQDTCDHKHTEEWNHHCYDGSCDHYWQCNDCGKRTCS